MTADDLPEVAALQRAADWRMRKVDADPADQASLRAARQLEKLAGELAAMQGGALATEFMAICNWLAESDDISDFLVRAEDFRTRLGFGTWAEDGETYLRILIGMARESSGTG